MANMDFILSKPAARSTSKTPCRSDQTLDTDLQIVKIGPFVAEIVESMQPMAEARRLELSFQANCSLETAVVPWQLVFAIQALIENAIEATRNGSVKVSVDGNDDQIRINVSDTGPGLSAAMAGMLFRPFVSFGKVGKLGNGLWGAKTVIDRHGGRISARNLEVGAQFTVMLPCLSRNS